MLFYLHQQHIVPDYCTKYEQNQHILIYITTNTYTCNLWKKCHNYSNLEQNQFLYYVHQQPMVLNHGTKYEEKPSSHPEECVKMDRQTRPIPIFLDAAIAERGIINNCWKKGQTLEAARIWISVRPYHLNNLDDRNILADFFHIWWAF